MKGMMRQVVIEGLNTERLVRRAGEQGIQMMNLRRRGMKVQVAVDEAELPGLRTLCEQGGWRMRTGSRCGAGRAMDWVRGRMLLAGGCVLAAMLAAVASQMMWRVDILGSERYEADIRLYLEQEGIRPVCRKDRVDTASLRDALEWRYPEIAWIETAWRGMTLQIRVAAGEMPGETLTTGGDCDVVAARDGIVASVITVAGTPLVKPGDIVREGQVLIRGEERTGKGELRAVAARGRVMARVWDAAAVTMSILEQQTVYTGRVYRNCLPALPWFALWKEDAPEYVQEDISIQTMPLGGVFIPMIISWKTHMEAEIQQVSRDLEQLKEEAGAAAMRKLRQKTGVSDDLVDKWVDYSMIDSEQVCAVAYGERVIDIARQQRH